MDTLTRRPSSHAPWWILAALTLVLSACGGAGDARDDDETPAAPTNVSATPGPGYVTVAWQHDGLGVSGFEIRRQPVADGDALARQQVETYTVGPEAREYVDLAVEPGQALAYQVVALGEAGASEPAAPPEAQGPATVEAGVDMVVGTRNHWAESTPGTAFLLYYVLPDEVLADSDTTFETTLEGPPGWNGDEAIVFASDVSARERQVGYLSYGTTATAAPGEYVLTVELLGGSDNASYTATATLDDASAQLGLPTDVAATSVSAGEVVVEWTPPTGAVSAAVGLFTDGYDETVAPFRYTTSSSLAFDGLALEDGTYIAQVATFDVDLADYPVKPTSYALSFDRVVFGLGSLTLAAGATASESALIADAVDRYRERNPGVTIEVLDQDDLGGDRLAAYQQALEAGSPDIDVLQVDVAWIGLLGEHLADLSDHGAGSVIGEHFPPQVENNTVGGALVAMPWFADAGLLYYRSDLLDAYGYDAPPQTWSELETMAAAIQQGERDAGDADFWGYVWQGNAYEGLTVNALEWIASNGGGTVVSPDGVVTIDNPAAVEMVARAAAWVGTISPSEVVAFAEENARTAFQAGNAAFMRNWPYAYALGQADGSPIAGLFDVAPLPAAEGGTSAGVLGGWNLAVSAYSDVPTLAADLALFLASTEEQKIRAVEGAYNPTIEALYDDPEVMAANPFFASLADVFEGATPRPTTVTGSDYAEVSTAFYTAVHDVLTGEQEAGPALEALSLEVQGVTGFPPGLP